MENLTNGVTRERMDFSRIKTSIPIPNLIEVQKKSYERFLQMALLPGEREDTGLQSVFNSVFPISDFRGLSQLEFVDYAIGNPTAPTYRHAAAYKSLHTARHLQADKHTKFAGPAARQGAKFIGATFEMFGGMSTGASRAVFQFEFARARG